MSVAEQLAVVAADARACTLCVDDLPHAPRAVFQVGAGARVVIIGQAPGRRVHESGVPWADPSSDRLRANPWFETEVLPEVRSQVAGRLRQP